MTGSLAHRAGLRYFARHPWLTVLSVAGIALGVAVVVSIDLANASAQRAFELSAARVAGRTTHQVVATEAVSGDVFRRLRVDAGLRHSAPVVEGYVVRAGRSYQLLGVDPFADRLFRPYVTDLTELDLGAFMGAAPVVLAPASIGAAAGDTLHVSIAGRTDVVTVGAVLEPQDDMSREAIDNLLIADVGTAQSLFAMGDRLSRIDLILSDEAEAARVEEVLPPGTRLVRSDTRTAAVDRMTAAFELNLNALSLLALVVAMFLIYNTITFSVVQRRTLLGRLRAIGLTRREVFRQILLEAVVMGTAGVVVGLLGGIGLAQALVRMVTQTINDLYYVLEVRTVSIEPLVLVKAAVLGMAATAAAAVIPAREAASAPVHVVLQRSEEETTMRSRLPQLSAAGAISACAAVLLLAVSGRNLVLSYAGLFLILAGFALLAPAATMWAARGARRILGIPFGLIGRMAAQGIVYNLSRTSVAIAALSIAVAATVGVGVMVGSFRDTVVDWLDYTLQADLYIQPPSSAFRLGQSVLSEDVLPQLGSLPGVRAAASVRRLDLLLSGGRIELAAIGPGRSDDVPYRFTSGDPARIWERFTEHASVLVSEPLAYRAGIGAGDSLEIPTDRGLEHFPVAGVFYDYGSDQGAALMTRRTFRRHFDASGLSGISLYLDPGSDPAQMADRVRAAVDGDVIVRSNRALREASMDVFDRTFAITTVLQVLSLLVAFAGVLSALMALQIERAGEFAILRAEGMTPGLLRRYVLLQTSLMGAISGLIALPLGLVLAYVLIFVINKRSFGWTLHFSAPPEVLLQALLLAGAAALLAGIYPSVALGRSDMASALRSE
jgi:putative ABC transport system permease protein